MDKCVQCGALLQGLGDSYGDGYAKGQVDMSEKWKLERDTLIKERDALIKERDDELAAIEKHNAEVDEMIRICENPPPPTEALVALFRDYGKTIVSDYDRGAADMRERAAKMCMAAQLTWANGELVSRIELPYDTDLSRRIRALPIKGE